MGNYTYLKDCENKKEIIQDFFAWLFDEPNIDLSSEIDLSLASKYYDPNIYYPEKLNKFFQTKAMQRLRKVSQLGSVIKIRPNCYNNRLDHSKGTYNRKVEELIYQMQNPSYKKYIEDNNLKLYLIAELIKEAGHDIGHLPLSHVMETTVIGKRGFHEEIGKKILTEDFEIQKVLKNISQKLPDILKESISTDVLNSQTHDESNYDVDRLDYLVRDALYLGFPIDFTVEPYEISFAKIDKNGNILTNPDGSISMATPKDTNKKRIDVYSNDNLRTIESFLAQRVHAYKRTYFSPENQILDSSIGSFLNRVLNSKDKKFINPEFLSLIENLKTQNLTDIDVNDLTKFDDLTFYRDTINIAENSSDKNMRDFATLTLPSLDSLMDFIYSSLNIKGSKKEDFSPDELEFIEKIKNLIHDDSPFSRNLKDKNLYNSNFIYCKNPLQIENLKKKWGSNIITSSSTVYAYKTKEPIFIKDKTGKTFTLDKHPERFCDWENQHTNMQCAFAFIPEFRLKGLDEKTIQEINEDFNDFLKFPVTKMSDRMKVNMNLLQTGHSMAEVFEDLEI